MRLRRRHLTLAVNVVILLITLSSPPPNNTKHIMSETSTNSNRLDQIGEFIFIRKTLHGYFQTYKSLLMETASELNCSRQTVRRTLEESGLWRKGKRGKPGGPQLIKMQDEIVEVTDSDKPDK
jgi:hypothetical protein